MKIKYVGLKDFEDAFRGDTGKTWGPGVEHDIEDAALCARMLRHPDVFAVSDGAAVKKPKAPTASSDVVSAPVADQIPVEPGHDQVATPEGDKGPRYVMRTDSGELLLDDLDKATLRELAKEAGLKIHHAKSEDYFRESLAAAFPVKAD